MAQWSDNPTGPTGPQDKNELWACRLTFTFTQCADDDNICKTAVSQYNLLQV